MENILFFFAGFPVYSYGFMLGLGLVLGTYLAQREAKRRGIGSDFVFQFIVKTAIVFIVVGRIGFVFSVHGWRMLLYPWVLFSGCHLDETRGLMGMSIYLLYFLVRHVENPAAFLDVLAAPVALMQSLAYLGSSVLGRETNVAWGIDLGEFSLHPLPLYSAFAFYVLYTILWRTRRSLRYDGQLFLGYLTLSAAIRRFLMSFEEVLGESANPWLYTFAAVVFGLAWLYVYLRSPFPDTRQRRYASDWQSWLIYLASLLFVGLIMTKFFYWRFS